MDSIIKDICNFQLSIFGISITLFTVLYSFILNKRDELRSYNEQIKTGTANPIITQKYNFAKSYIKKIKEVNRHLKRLVIISLLCYLISCFIINFPIIPLLIYILKILVLIVAGGTMIYICIILFVIFRQYTEDTKI